MAKKKQKFYAVGAGYLPGIYMEWFGKNGAEIQVKGFPGARYQGFSTLAEARKWLKDFQDGGQTSAPAPDDLEMIENEKEKQTHGERAGEDIAAACDRELNERVLEKLEEGKIIIYTDGGCINNPGPGGYGVVLLSGSHRKELSGGFRLTTNNRMELLACIEGLKTLKQPSDVILFSDSRYVVDGINKGWARRWQKNRWMRSFDKSAENVDLWAQLLELCAKHTVEFSWVRGHTGETENERCDRLATLAAADTANQARDMAFETGRTTAPGAGMSFSFPDSKKE